MSEPQTIIAIDPSLTGTAVVIGSHPERYHIRRFDSKPLGKDLRGRFSRAEDLVARIIDFCECDNPVSHLLIEDYSFGSNDASSKYVAEFRGMLCFELLGMFPAAQPVEVAPGTLKKFVTGKGSAKKEIMRIEAYKRWQVEFGSNDEVDAYGLYRIGLCLSGFDVPEIKPQAEVIEALQKKIQGAALEPAPF